MTGERRLDLAVRLEADGLRFELVAGDRRRGEPGGPGGMLDVIANYTAFQQIRTAVGRAA